MSSERARQVKASVCVVPEVFAMGLRRALEHGGIHVVGEDDDADVAVVVADAPCRAERRLVVLDKPPVPKVLLGLFSDPQTGGVVLTQTPPEMWPLAVRSVSRGGYWIDPHPAIAGELLLGHRQAIRHGPLGVTAQELRVLRDLPGRSNRELAAVLGVSPETIKAHLTHLTAKLTAYDRVHLVERAEALGLLDARRT